MGSKRAKLPMIAGLVLLAGTFSFAGTHAKKHPEAKANKASHPRAGHPAKKAKKIRGQQAIDTTRTREIQQALIREHYLNGEPSGKWDATTQAAMHRYQADQGWQSKTVPDSRALIRLGLGPDREHLLNPESAMITEPRLRQTTQASSRRAAAGTLQPVSAPVASVPPGSAGVPASESGSAFSSSR